jgi:hypothetical protein
MSEEAKSAISYEDSLKVTVGQNNKTFNNDGTPASADANRNANAQADAKSKEETASITLRGYPLLKGKSCIEVTGVGKGSGKWYCKTVIQTWSVEHGYYTKAQLTKGKGGTGGGAGENPVPQPPPRGNW